MMMTHPLTIDDATRQMLTTAVLSALLASDSRDLTLAQLLTSVRARYPSATTRAITSVVGDLVAAQRIQPLKIGLPYGKRSFARQHGCLFSESQR